MGSLLNIKRRETRRIVVRLFNAVKVEFRPLFSIGLDYLCGEVVTVTFSVVAKENRTLCSFFGYNDNTAHTHHVHACSSHVYHLNRSFQFSAFGQVDEQSVLCQKCVEQGDTVMPCFKIAVVGSGLVVVLL